MNSREMEIAIADYFNYRINTIVPNAWYGAGIHHECDMLVVTPSGYATEIEIKISRSDLLKDLKKDHSHESKKIKKLFFAIPKEISGCCDKIPERAGILIVYSDIRTHVKCVRAAKQIGNYKWSQEEVAKLNRLGSMRIFNLKQKILRLEKRTSLTPRLNPIVVSDVINFLSEHADYASLLKIENYLVGAKNRISIFNTTGNLEPIENFIHPEDR